MKRQLASPNQVLMKILLFLLSALLLSGCAIAPVKLRLVRHEADADLHTLLSRALVKPETADSKDALAHFIERWKEESRGERGFIEGGAAAQGMGYEVRFAAGRPGTYSPVYFDQLRPADDFELQKLPHHRRAGAGVTMMALRENRHREPLEHFYPPEAITRPVTALATVKKVSANRNEVRIELVCPLSHERADGRALAADYSVPWGALLARSGKLKQSQLLDFLSRTPSRQSQLYLMEPYHPKKEPLIMIHGLLSSPLVWAKLSNELWADEVVRSRFQIWHFHYNTSAPALYSTRLLRAQLRTLRQQLDPEGDDPAMRHTTLITHSMGGLVGKSLAVQPGNVFWEAAFTVPPEKLAMNDADRAMLNDAFSWEQDRSIRRIIFIAVPHRGSDFADNTLGRIGGWLTSPPTPFRQFYGRISRANPGAFTPEYEALGRGELDSVHSLSPKQPTLRILASLPFPSTVQIHSIIGNRGKAEPLEQSSDGVVPYHSSHLEKVVSEKIVPEGHGCVSHPETMAEVRRILAR
jgi:pimeloyl-ACP methyl ester carboxylesterase